MAPRKPKNPASGPAVTGVADIETPDVAVAAPAVTLHIKTAPHLRKKDFLERVIARSGLPRGQARIAIEATLAQLAEILLSEEEANLPPLGKLKVTRSKDNGRNRVLMVKLVHPSDSGNDDGVIAGSPPDDPG